MNCRRYILLWAVAAIGGFCFAQDSAATIADDWKPSSLNQFGEQYPQVNSQGYARFRITAPQADSVTVNIGDTQMTKGEDGVWTGTTARPLDEGFHYYRLNIDGATANDDGTLTFYGSSRLESGIEIPAHDQDFYTLKDVPHGHIRQDRFYSPSTSAWRRIFVYLPPDYDTNTSARYPVLYLQHGGGEDETGWPVQGLTDIIMDNLIAGGKAKPFIIVMASSSVPGAGGRGGAPRGAMPARGEAPGAPAAAPGAAAGGGARDGRGAQAPGEAGARRGGARGGFGAFNFDAFQTILIKEMIPYIDSHYRTLADQPNRAMAGLSMGGMQTRTITLANLDKFSHIGIFSGGSLSMEDVNNAQGFKDKVKLVFVSYGSRELGNRVGGGVGGDPKENVEALKQAGINSAFYVSENTAHEWQTWRRSLHEFAPLLFRDTPTASSAQTVMAFSPAVMPSSPAVTVSSPVDASRKLKNAPVPSAGRGKELGDFKSGTYTIESAGLTRQYTIEIPENYDKNTPYRLIFAMHMMGGHMNTMVQNQFYGLKTYAQKDNVPVIFVAPEGYTDQSPWRGRDDKDHIFFADMLALFKDKLSIDTSRVFCCGFSFGAMVTYSLSLDFQNDLRAVACYAPANWNIYLPENKHKPLAYFSTTGTEDGLCKYVNSDERKQGGKYCVLTHIEDNGLKELPEIPLATGPTHVTTEFKGLPEEYPVLFGSFVGGHTDNARDPGSDVNWIAKETWDFFMRF